jgi:hypothetical protein
MHPGYTDKIRISPSGLSVTEKTISKILTFPMYPEFDLKVCADTIRASL